MPRLAVAGAHAKDKFKNEQIDCRGYAYENGIDSVTRKPANEFSRVETWKPEGSFLFGLIIGAGGMLLLPEFTTRPEKLEGQVRDLSDQLKKMTQQKPGDDQPKQASPSPSPHLGDLKGCVTKRFRRRSTILSRIG